MFRPWISCLGIDGHAYKYAFSPLLLIITCRTWVESVINSKIMNGTFLKSFDPWFLQLILRSGRTNYVENNGGKL